jgi:flagellar hook assembly protein FlgD
VAEFSLNLPEACDVSFVIYNVTGQRVRTLVDESLSAGVRRLAWDGTSDTGSPVSDGIYFYRVVAGDNTFTDKVMVVK